MGKFPTFFALLFAPLLAAAAFGALAGLLGGLYAGASGLLDERITFPDGPNRQDLLRAGFMHDASYLAGALGTVAAISPMRQARSIDLHTSRKGTSHAT